MKEILKLKTALWGVGVGAASGYCGESTRSWGTLLIPCLVLQEDEVAFTNTDERNLT